VHWASYSNSRIAPMTCFCSPTRAVGTKTPRGRKTTSLDRLNKFTRRCGKIPAEIEINEQKNTNVRCRHTTFPKTAPKPYYILRRCVFSWKKLKFVPTLLPTKDKNFFQPTAPVAKFCSLDIVCFLNRNKFRS
jgi:hypothetical protein